MTKCLVTDRKRESILMGTFKEYLEEKQIVHCYTLYPYENMHNIPNYYVMKKQGMLQQVIVETCGSNGGCIKRITLFRQWRTGKFFIHIDVFNAHWKKLKSGLKDADSHVKFKYLITNGRKIVLEDNVIKFRSTNVTSSIRSKRDRILSDIKLPYIYSEANYTVHDKSCRLVESIPDEYILGSAKMPSNHIVCEECKKRLFLRLMIGQDGKRIALYLKFMERARVDDEIILKLAKENNAQLYLEEINLLRISCNMDTWKIAIDNAGMFCQLQHNSYILLDDGTRYMTGGYHNQKGEFKDVNQVISFIMTYSFEAHLADDWKSGFLVNRTERRAIFQVYRKVEIKSYIEYGLTHELLQCEWNRRKEAQTKLIIEAGIDIQKPKYVDNLGTVKLSQDLVAGMRLFTEHVLSKKDYNPELLSRRILVQLGIQEMVKPIIATNIKMLGAYLCTDTKNGRKGYAPEILQSAFEMIHGREDFKVIALEDLQYLMHIGNNDNLMTQLERDGAIKKGIRIVTGENYMPIGESPFIDAYISARGSSIVYTQLLKYMESSATERKRYDEVYEQLNFYN